MSSFRCQDTLWALALSFTLCALVTALEVGLVNTPYETVDRQGRSMGFNDPFSLEHYRIMLGNFGWHDLVDGEHDYSLLLLGAHLVGAVVVLLCCSRKWQWTRWYFALQGVLFPMGWIGLFFLPYNLWTISSGEVDRECTIDYPMVRMVMDPIWFVMACVVFFLIRAELIRVSRRGTPSR